MNGLNRLLGSLQPRLLRLATGVTWGCLVLCLAGLGARCLLLESETRGTHAKIRARESDLVEAQRVLESAKSEPLAPRTEGLTAVTRLQGVLEGLCRENECATLDYQVAPDKAPFLSVYTKSAAEAAWQQVEVRAVLSGPLEGLMRALRAVAHADCPVEVVSLDLGADPGGGGRVVASVQFHVVTPGGTA